MTIRIELEGDNMGKAQGRRGCSDSVWASRGSGALARVEKKFKKEERKTINDTWGTLLLRHHRQQGNKEEKRMNPTNQTNMK
jgi:hypothetical protein